MSSQFERAGGTDLSLRKYWSFLVSFIWLQIIQATEKCGENNDRDIG